MSREPGSADERALLEALLRRDGFTVPGAGAIGRRPGGGPDRAGAPQRRFWIQERVDGEQGQNVLSCLIRFDRRVDAPDLDAALRRLFDRHEALRTRFEECDGQVVERVDGLAPPPVERIDGGPESAAAVAGFVGRPLPLDRGPLWRVAMFSDPAASGVLLLVFHHAIVDLAGIGVFARELDALLPGAGVEAPSLREEPLQQADHARWRAGDERRQRRDADAAYWRDRLAGMPPALVLPACDRRVAGTGCRHATLDLHPELVGAIRQFAAQRGSTPFFVLLAAYAVVLGRFAMSQDVAIGTAVDNRETPGADAILGCLSDLIPLRCDLSGASGDGLPGFGATVERLHRACGQDFQHAGIGFTDIVTAAQAERRAGVAPLFQALFNLLPVSRDQAPRLTPLPAAAARADFALELTDDGTDIAGRLETRVGLVPGPVATALAEAFTTVLQHGIGEPDVPADRLPLTAPDAAAALIERLNPPLPAAPEETLVDMFRRRGEIDPQATALIEGSREVSYAELDARSERLATTLVMRGLKPGEPVALALDRSADLVVAFLGAMRAGGAAMALNTEYPAVRLAAILEDSGARFLIGRDRPGWLPSDVGFLDPASDDPVPTAAALPPVRPEDPAYIIYTSGSTGRPKGVVGLHRGMANRLSWYQGAFPFGAGEIACLKTTPAFADFLAEMFGPLFAGVPAVIADAATAQDPMALTELIRRQGVTRVVLVPSLLRACLDMVPDIGERLAGLRLCVTSGETLPAALAARFKAAVPGCRLVNFYGASEVSADATRYEVAGCERDPVPIGAPIAGNRLAVTDPAGMALPIGVPGDIAIAGLGVAQGYLNDPDLTDRRFATIPALASDGPAFRTGDLGFWDGEGRLVYLGRGDRQVKIQGVRVEPLEIEAAIEAYPRVKACYVVDRREEGAEAVVLHAYVVMEAGTGAEESAASREAALRAFLIDRLPRALVPARFAFPDALPLTASGKIDRSALPPIPLSDAEPAAGENRRPGGLAPMEAVIAAQWSAVLGRPVESADVDFFRHGGGSLQAILVATRIGKVLERTVSPALLFECPVLGTFARRVMAETDSETMPLPLPRHGEAEDLAPVTTNQLWLWREYGETPSRIAYNLAVAYELTGPLVVEALDGALCDMLARHESLRTHLSAPDGATPYQVVGPVPATLLDCVDLSEAPDPDAAFRDFAAAAEAKPFALDRDLSFRASLVILGPERHVLVLILHHVASDGWSGQILVRELGTLYSARLGRRTPPAPPPALQLGDVARWQQEIRPLLAARIDGYRQALSDAAAPRLAGVTEAAAATGPVGTVAVPVSAGAFHRLEAVGRARGASRFVTVLAAWSVMLARFADVERPLVAFPQAGRNAPGLDSLVGFLANTVLLAPDLRAAGDFNAALDAAHRSLVSMMRYQDVPLAWLQAAGGGWPEDSAAVRSMVIVEDLADWKMDLPGLSCDLTVRPRSPEARTDLALLVTETEAGTEICIEFAMQRIPGALASRLARGLACVMTDAAASPDTDLARLALVDPADEAAAVASAQPTPAPVADRLEQVLEIVAGRHASAAATDDLRTVFSYRELRDRAEGVAAVLQASGVAPGERVGLVAAPSPLQLAALFGIWRLGATAVPVDPSYPQARIAWTLADADVRVALCDRPQEIACPQLPLDAHAVGTFRDGGAPGAPAAAIIYTSGTTGEPKGVSVSHEALCRLGAALAEAFEIGPGDRVLQVVSPAFDVALSDIAMTVSAAATLVASPRETVLPGRSLSETLEQGRITHMQAPASVLAATRPAALSALRTVAVGGEVCARRTLEAWADGRRLFIAYGPSEATVTAALTRFTPDLPSGSIGHPFCGATLAVTDDAGRPLPVGVAGELTISGAGVAEGYLNRRDLTAARFQLDPAGSHTYRTGDRARMEPDGSFTFLGRSDRQIKLRGFRIEPGEIEAALAALPEVAQAVVALSRREDQEYGDLVAWTVPAPGQAVDGDRARNVLKQQLPAHMVPAAIVVISDLPLTPNGKVDIDALPLPGDAGDPAAAMPPSDELARRNAPDERAPTGEAEIRRYLVAVWQELLPGRLRIDIDRSFFDIGGHSLLVVRLQERLEERFAMPIPIGELFANPTVRALAAMLDRRQRAAVAPPLDAFEEFVI